MAGIAFSSTITHDVMAMVFFCSGIHFFSLKVVLGVLGSYSYYGLYFFISCL